jgi:hypothetical protein
MIKEFTFHGQWFLPENRDKTIAGTLVFNTKEDAELTLFGTLYEERTNRMHEPPIILGRTTTGQFVTLYKPFEYQSKMQNGVMSSVYSVLYAFINSHYYGEESLKFIKVEARFKGIDDWMKKYGFTVDNNFDTNEVQVHYKRPEDILVQIDTNINANIRFAHSFPWTGSVNEVHVSQQAYFQLTFASPVSFNDMMDNLMAFQNFLTLGTFEPAYPISINVYTLDSQNAEDEICSELIYKPGFNYVPKTGRGIFLFYYGDIESNFTDIIRKWFTLQNSIEPVIDLLLNSFYTRNLGFDIRFLQMAQAIETFHRRLLDKKPFDETEFKAWTKALVESVEEKYKEMLRGKLSFSNEQPLHARIEECVDKLPIDSIKQIVGDKTKFIRDVKHTRNYLTHYSPGLKSKALSGDDLFKMRDRLRIVLVATVLLETGFQLEQIEKVIRKNGIYLFNHIYKPQSLTAAPQ